MFGDSKKAFFSIVVPTSRKILPILKIKANHDVPIFPRPLYPISVMEENKNSELEEAKQEASPDLKYRSKKEVALSGALGFFIGLAIIVPGISGSAVAIIFRLYEKLLYALGNILKRFKYCALFLLPILLGAIVGLVLGFIGVQQLLNLIPLSIVFCFAGLMAGAYPAITDQLKGEKPSIGRIALFAIGLLIPIALSLSGVFLGSGFPPLQGLAWYWYPVFVLLGFVVAITQLVPGLSATAILMMVGCFSLLVDSVSLSYWKENPYVLLVYACLAIGLLIGLVAVSKGMSKLLSRFHGPCFYCIAGLSLGSIASMFYNPDMVDIYSSFAFDAKGITDLCLGIALFIAAAIGAYMLVRVERKKGQDGRN